MTLKTRIFWFGPHPDSVPLVAAQVPSAYHFEDLCRHGQFTQREADLEPVVLARAWHDLPAGVFGISAKRAPGARFVLFPDLRAYPAVDQDELPLAE